MATLKLKITSSFLSITIMFFLLVFFQKTCFADIKYIFSPFINIQNEYTSNLFLDRSKRPDLITTFYPGLNYSILFPKGSCEIRYAPGFTIFKHHSQYDYTSQNFSLAGNYALSQHIKLDFADDYMRTNEPSIDQLFGYETGTGIQGISYGGINYGGPETLREYRTNSRFVKNINTCQPRLTYQFGEENFLQLYYRNTLYKDDNPANSNFVEHSIQSRLDYWFTAKNGIGLNYEHIIGDFDSEPDVNSDRMSSRFTHRFSPHFELYGEYDFLTVNYDDNTGQNQGQSNFNNFDNHAGNLGFRYDYSPHIAFNGYAGYYFRRVSGADNNSGPDFLLGTTLSQQHLTFNCTISKGSYIDFFSASESGYNKYWGITTSLDYQLRQNLFITSRGEYFKRDYKDNTATQSTDNIYRFISNITYNFSRFASFQLAYTYEDRAADISTNSYIVNKITAMITFYNTWSNMKSQIAPSVQRQIQYRTMPQAQGEGSQK